MNRSNIVALFCEDIREEKNDFITLIGIFPDVITLAPQPGETLGEGRHPIFVKFCVYLRFNFSLDIDLPLYTVRLVAPRDQIFELGKIDAELVSKAKNDAKDKGTALAGITLRAILNNLTLLGPGLLRAEVQHGDEAQVVGGIHFTYQPDPITSPTASPPLS